jgi:hypothetical protein
MKSYIFNAHLKFDVDPELSLSIEYFDRYKYLQEKVSQVFHIVDKQNGKPVKWVHGFKFNQDKHALTKYFDEEIIKSYPHNKQITLAYCEDGVATIKLYLSEKYSWRTEIEKRFLAIVSNLIFNKVRSTVSQVLRNQNRQAQILTKNELYNILLVLNSKLTSPLDEGLVNKLTTYIWLKYVNDEIRPPIEVKKSIRSKSFMDEFFYAYPECKYYSLKKAVREEVNRIKADCRRQKYNKIISEFKNKHPDSRYTDIVNMLCNKCKLKKSNASKIYCEWKKVSSPTSLDKINDNIFNKISNDTFSSMCKMENFILSYEGTKKLTQIVVSSGSGVSIAQVKRNWHHFKKVVDKLKKKNKKK